MSKFSVFLKDVEVDAEKALSWLTKEETKVAAAAPKVQAALGALAGLAETILADTAAAAGNPTSITLDQQLYTDLKAAWPEVVAFLGTIGVKAKA
jgi:hypothetical protein